MFAFCLGPVCPRRSSLRSARPPVTACGCIAGLLVRREPGEADRRGDERGAAQLLARRPRDARRHAGPPARGLYVAFAAVGILIPSSSTPFPSPLLYTSVASRPGVHVGVMLDTKGPEIRTGFLGGKKTVEYVKGSTVEVVTDYARPGDEKTCVPCLRALCLGTAGGGDWLFTCPLITHIPVWLTCSFHPLDSTCSIACSYVDLPKTTEVGGMILVADGALVLKVLEIKADSVVGACCLSGLEGGKKRRNGTGPCRLFVHAADHAVFFFLIFLVFTRDVGGG